MMEFKQIIDQFKAKYAKTGVLDPSRLPFLMIELVNAGLDISKADGNFYQSLSESIYPGQTREFQIDIVDGLLFLGQILAPPKTVEKIAAPKTPTKEAIVAEDGTIRTDHLDGDAIPDEDSEGDPYYIAPEDQIKLRPEDCEPMHIDHEFMSLVGAKGYEK